MEWVITGAFVGIVTVSAFIGSSVANYFSADHTTDNEQNNKINKLENSLNSVNVDLKTNIVSTNNFSSTTVALLVALSVIQFILMIIAIWWIVKKCNEKPRSTASRVRRNSFELQQI